MSAFALPQQSSMTEAEIISPAKPDIFIEYWTLYRKRLPTPALKSQVLGPHSSVFKIRSSEDVCLRTCSPSYICRPLLCPLFSWRGSLNSTDLPLNFPSAVPFPYLPLSKVGVYAPAATVVCPLRFSLDISSPHFCHPPGINFSFTMPLRSTFFNPHSSLTVPPSVSCVPDHSHLVYLRPNSSSFPPS